MEQRTALLALSAYHLIQMQLQLILTPTVYVTTFNSGCVLEYNGDTDTLENTIANLGDGVDGIAVNTNNNYIYVAHFYGATVSIVIDGNSNSVIKNINLSKFGASLYGDPGTVVVNQNTNFIS